MSHDPCLYSNHEEFPLVGCPDAETPGLGRAKIFSGNAAVVVVERYEQHCRDLDWNAATWAGRAGLAYLEPPEWADPSPVARHIAMVNAFLAFAPGAKFGTS